MLLLVVGSAALAVAVNHLRPSPLPWTEQWDNRVEIQALELGIRVADLETARTLVDGGMATIFDARPFDVFGEGHLPMALSLPSEPADRTMEEKFLMEYAGLVAPDMEILVYCSGELCDESLQVSRFLVEQGFTNVVLFVEGFEAWTKADYPTEAGW
jgi:rhodanese-related sulfurtransferase